MTAMQRLKDLNATPPPDPNDLWRHFSATYLSIRLGLAVLSFAFPVLLWQWGRQVHALPLQPSMSAYFWAAGPDDCASFPMRTIFVGILVAIGAGMFVYKGLTTLENWLLNGAGVLAAMVAFFPERLLDKDKPPTERVQKLFDTCPAIEQWARHQQPDFPVHYLAAVGMFVLLFLVAMFCASKSLEYLPPNPPVRKETFRRLYLSLAQAMLVVGIFGGWAVYEELSPHATFWLEAGEIWIFAAYWALKSYEMSLTKLQKDPAQAVGNAAATGALARIEEDSKRPAS